MAERKDLRREVEAEVKEGPTSLTLRGNERERERKDEGDTTEEDGERDLLR